MALTAKALSDAQAMGDKSFRDAWCQHIEGKPLVEKGEAVKMDAKGETAGTQVDYPEGVFIYESYDVFLKRAVVWASTHFSDDDVKRIIDKKKTDEVTSREDISYVEEGKDKAEIVERILEKWGPEQGHYEKIHTLPDGSIYVKLKEEYRG